MATEKDIISKQILKRIFIDVATYLFKLELQQVELVETEQQRIEDRRSDLVASVIDKHGKAFVVHIEIQNQNHPKMPERMLRYFTDIRFSQTNPLIYQYLLYISKPPLRMDNGIRTEQLEYRYQVLDMRQMDFQFFIQQNSAEALVLAVLCHFGKIKPRAAVHEILTRLITLLKEDTKGLREYVSMLEILATNRNLNINIQREFKMLEIEIEQLPSYLIGEQRGMRKGVKDGLEKGVKQGLEKGVRQGLEKGVKQGLEKGVRQGLEQGVKQGAHDKAVAIAKQLLPLMQPIEVARITGLTVIELEQLIHKSR